MSAATGRLLKTAKIEGTNALLPGGKAASSIHEMRARNGQSKVPSRLEENAAERQLGHTLRIVADTISSCVMLVDRSSKVRYANPAAERMLEQYRREFSTEWPGLGRGELLGATVDVFSKDPSRQRLLADPRNLPIESEISLGTLRFSLRISATFAPDGTYNGTLLEWNEVTDRVVQEELSLDYKSQIAAIGKSQATISFAMDGTVLDANENFLAVIGYALDEIKGRHHRMFVDPAHQSSDEYQEFWARLYRGEYQAAEYKRVGKGGKEVWIQASYNPIFNSAGEPVKVIKFASDVSAQVAMRQSMANLLLSIGDVSVTIAGSAEELTNVSQELSTHADATAHQASSVSLTSTRVSTNVNVVAASSEEMMVSIREIAKSASEAARIAKSAVNPGRDDEPHHPAARHVKPRDRQGDQGHYLDCAADQPACFERND